MDILDRISMLLKGREQQELTDFLGLKSVAFSEWKSGKSKSYRKYLIEIADFFSVSLDYLVYGKENELSTDSLLADERSLLDTYKKLSPINKGRIIERAEMLAEIEASEPDRNENEDPETIFIEYSTCSVSAGTGEPLIDDSQPDFIEVISSDLTEQANFAVKINGDSMLPRFKNDDIVLVRSQPSVEVGEIGIFIVDGCGYIKEYASDRLVSLNPEYDDIYFSEGQEVWCKGRVIGILEDEDFV